MSQTPPYPGQPTPPGGQPPASVIYVSPPSNRPSLFRAMLSGVGRIVTASIIFLIFSMLVLGTFAAMGEMGFGAAPEVYRDGSMDQKVAIIELASVIDGEAAEFMRHAVETVLADDTYAVVVFRVDSPGGGVTASDQIWYQIGRLKQDGRRVIASYGGIAASGGVYVSCHSDYIFAEPTTITGSIGVIAQILTFGEMMNKVGIEPVTMVAEGSPNKDTANDIFRPWTEEDRAKIQPILNHSYEVFFDRVFQGRKHVINDEAALHVIADGSIYTADEALGNGLIDAVGYLDDAIDYAIKDAGMPADAAAIIIRPWEGGWGLPFVKERKRVRAASAPGRLQDVLNGNPETVRLWWHELSRPRAMYLMP